MPAAKDAKVIEASVEYAQGLMDMRFLNGSARATLTMNDGTTLTFDWFHDEITYVPADFVGKTRDEIATMQYENDVKYLRS